MYSDNINSVGTKFVTSAWRDYVSRGCTPAAISDIDEDLREVHHPVHIITVNPDMANMERLAAVYAEIHCERLHVGFRKGGPPLMGDLHQYLAAGVCFQWHEQRTLSVHYFSIRCWLA